MQYSSTVMEYVYLAPFLGVLQDEPERVMRRVAPRTGFLFSQSKIYMSCISRATELPSTPSAKLRTPLVSGTVALLMSAKPQQLTQCQAATALSHAVQLTLDLSHGRLDVYQAISAWLSTR